MRYNGLKVSTYLITTIVSSLSSDFEVDQYLERLFYDQLVEGDKKFYLLLEEITLEINKKSIKVKSRYEKIMSKVFNRILSVNKIKYFEVLLRQAVINYPFTGINLFNIFTSRGSSPQLCYCL